MTASFLVIVQIVLVIILVIAVLLQKSSSIGLGAYSGSNDSVFGAKGPSSFLAKATFTIGFLFVINTITLGYMYSTASQASVVDDLVESTNVVAPNANLETVPAPTAETTPLATEETTPLATEETTK
ncbi:preprotein translocase subunit SecG [Sulfurimonas sp.]|nr:preprotein translocase subunit SecG [Sulfurimonas sp.]